MSDFETIIRKPNELGDRLLDQKNRKKYCDVEIVVDTERIAVHKTILASASTYFDTIFGDNESKVEVIMEFMDLEIVQSLIEYCYTGIIRVSKKNMHEIMRLAIFFKMNPIIEGCVKILEKKMDSSNCISTWKLAQTENFKNLRNVAFEYAKQNYEKVSQSPAFLYLNDSEILELLSSDIIVANETIVLNSVKKWISHNSTPRKQHLDKLSKYIRFKYLPENILSSSEFQSFCYDNSPTECLNKVLNALRWKNDKKPKPSDGNSRESYTTLMVVNVGFFNKPKPVEIFDLQNEKWIQIENIECDRIVFSAVLLEHKLMLIGGESVMDVAVNTVQSYDLKTCTMENLPPMKYARSRLSAVEFKGCVYAIGGVDKIDLAYLEMWDPVLKTWKDLAPMSIPRNGFEARVMDKEIFVVGGSAILESYNLVTDKWRTRASMNVNRFAPGVMVINGYLYVAGGHGTNDVYVMTAERYDPKIDKWILIHSLNIGKYRMGSGNLFGRFVIVGGNASENQPLSTMEMYDDENDKWISMPSLNEPQSFLTAVEIPWPLAEAMLSKEIQK